LSTPAANTSPTARFRVVALLEGISLLALFLVAMPLKYGAGMPQAVRIVGWVHGVLFIWYMAEVADLAMRKVWNRRHVLLAMVASSIPVATFWLDRRIRREEAAALR
jgi:integral membrane protein